MNNFTQKNFIASKFLAFITALTLLLGAFPLGATAFEIDVNDAEPIVGCMDPLALNYEATATMPGACEYGPEQVLGCTDPLADNYNEEATVADGSCVNTLVFYCGYEDALNYGEEGDCLYDDGMEEITACKYTTEEEPIEGWGMVITNDGEGEGEVTFDELTEEDGCVSVLVYPEDGPFYVVEDVKEGWIQEDVYDTNGQVFEGRGGEYCEFFDDEIIDKKEIFTAQVAIEDSAYRCDFFNAPIEEVVDVCLNLDGPQEDVPEEMTRTEAGDCVPEETDDSINTCLVPNTLGDESAFSINNSGEKTVAEMLAEHGYAAVDTTGTTSDQINYQVWNLTDPTADTITFNLTVLGKRAGNTQILGYYKAGDGSTFASVLTQVSDTNGEAAVSVTIPAAFANSFGFGIKSADMTWYSEKALNSDGKDHVAVYNPAANTYLLAFEDIKDLGDGDYNDLVVEIADVTCVPPPPPVDTCLNLEGFQNSIPEGMIQNQAGDCVPEETDDIINTCLVPSTLGDESEFVINNSGEKTVAQMLADHGYVAVDTTNDQINYQVWDLVDPAADTVTFNVKVLGKRAGNSQIMGYYQAGNGLTFTTILAQLSDTDGAVSVPVTIPAAFASSFGFSIQSDDMTWYSEKSLNTDGKDHVAVYNPAANTYLLAFEDFINLGDGDYNDLVVEIANVACTDEGDNDTPNSNGGSSNGGSSNRSKRSGTPQVAGETIAVPEPAPLVLGEQVSVTPYGAPAAGGGGTSPVSATTVLAHLLMVNPSPRTKLPVVAR